MTLIHNALEVLSRLFQTVEVVQPSDNICRAATLVQLLEIPTEITRVSFMV